MSDDASQGSYHGVETDGKDGVTVELGYHDVWDRLMIEVSGFDRAGWESVCASAWVNEDEARMLGQFLLDWANRGAP